jgi:hypothetical protein
MGTPPINLNKCITAYWRIRFISTVNDPLMYQSVALFQKEMRDSIKMAYDLQKKMKASITR